jgi:F420-non-reducing hydrogenase small subunit
MPEKPNVGFYWCASCGGCEESIVDLAEGILDVVNAVNIKLWPVAMDFKKSDVEAMADGSLLVTMINGAIRTSEQEEMAKLLRRKSKLIIAYGSCAHTGGIPGLANQFERDAILDYVYDNSPSTVNESKERPRESHTMNGITTTLPKFFNIVRSLDQVIEVDAYLPGCPPTPKLLKQALDTLLSGTIPPKGTVLAPDIALCEECPRKDTKPTDLSITEFHRPHQVMIDPETCLLAQGLVCMGPATRGGCESACVKGNMPCSGCFGPTSRLKDQGAKILSCVASSAHPKEDEEIIRMLAGIPDPVGTFYRYGMPVSLLRGKVTQ